MYRNAAHVCIMRLYQTLKAKFIVDFFREDNAVSS